ncbi:MAG: hypothetical protein KAT71_05050 [Gammaproteobacteria bacterium]|nr:hypothetical protein [Gammaproteobacteria bacterium]
MHKTNGLNANINKDKETYEIKMGEAIIQLKTDGTILFGNSNGAICLEPDGEITIDSKTTKIAAKQHICLNTSDIR